MKAACSGEAGRMVVRFIWRKCFIQPESSRLVVRINQKVLHVDNDICERLFLGSQDPEERQIVLGPLGWLEKA